MPRLTRAAKQELRALAVREIAQERNDVLAFADRNRESVDLPEGLENGYTQRRKRGTRTDLDCINEICELVSQGITANAAVKYVGVPWATWHKWQHLNHCEAARRYEFAYKCHLEAMADKTLQVFERLEKKREECLQKYYAEHREWRNWKPKEHDGEERPIEPIYEGPAEWELNLTKEKVRVWHLHLQSGLERFRKRLDATVSSNTTRLAVHEVTIKKDATPEEALRAYQKLIEGKVG